MSLQLFVHSFSSYCQKALIALYEHAVPFELRMLGAQLEKHWPLKRFPVLLDLVISFGYPEAPLNASSQNTSRRTYPEDTTQAVRIPTYSFRSRPAPPAQERGWRVA
jgi:hypothetical protein